MSEYEVEERWFVKKACVHCPFKRENRLFGYMERVEDFAYMANSPFTHFHCHKTGETDEESGDYVANADSLECAGLLSMKINEGTISDVPGFKPDPACFEDSYEMIEAYRDDGTPELGNDDEWD